VFERFKNRNEAQRKLIFVAIRP